MSDDEEDDHHHHHHHKKKKHKDDKNKDKKYQEVDPRIEAGRRQMEGWFSKNNRNWIISGHLTTGDRSDILEVYTHCTAVKRRTYVMKLSKQGRNNTRELLREMEALSIIYSTEYVNRVNVGESRFPFIYEMGVIDETEAYERWVYDWIEKNPDNPQVASALTKQLPILPFYIMEKLTMSLDQLVASAPQRKLGKRLSIMIALGCYKAVTALHELGLIHRHICPKNFAIRTPRGATVPQGDKLFHHIVLIDFGMAAAWPSNPLQEKDFEGSVKYSSPNLHEFRWPGAIDDMWSLHYMITEMLIHPQTLPWHHCTEVSQAGELKKVAKPGVIYGQEMEELMLIHKELKKGDPVTKPSEQIGRLYEDLHERIVQRDIFPMPGWLPFMLGERF